LLATHAPEPAIRWGQNNLPGATYSQRRWGQITPPWRGQNYLLKSRAAAPRASSTQSAPSRSPPRCHRPRPVPVLALGWRRRRPPGRLRALRLRRLPQRASAVRWHLARPGTRPAMRPGRRVAAPGPAWPAPGRDHQRRLALASSLLAPPGPGQSCRRRIPMDRATLSTLCAAREGVCREAPEPGSARSCAPLAAPSSHPWLAL